MRILYLNLIAIPSGNIFPFAKFQNPKFGWRDVMLSQRGFEILLMRVYALFRVFGECAKMHPDALLWRQKPVSLYGVIGIYMLIFHEPSFFVVANWKNSQAKMGKARFYGLDEVAISGIAGKINFPGGQFYDKSTPQRSVIHKNKSAGRMQRRDKSYLQI